MPKMRVLRLGSVDYEMVGSASVTQTLTSGTEIATVTIDGTATKLYAPSGGGGEAMTDAEVVAAVDAAWPTVDIDVTIHYRDDSSATISGGTATVVLEVGEYPTAHAFKFGSADNVTHTFSGLDAGNSYSLAVTVIELPSYDYSTYSSTVTGSAADGFDVTVVYVYAGGN